MARMNVNPTRMELKKLKARLKTAERGHKLLKDKTDEMVRRFSVIIRETKALRDEVEKDVAGVLKQFSVARGLMSKSDIELIFSMPSVSVELECTTKNIMNVEVPALQLTENRSAAKYPYSFADVTSEADYSVELAGLEKTTMMLAEEIEKSKRRVNALEYVMIPSIEETIRYITMKLDENERSGLTRLMKVKDMIAERDG